MSDEDLWEPEILRRGQRNGYNFIRVKSDRYFGRQPVPPYCVGRAIRIDGQLRQVWAAFAVPSPALEKMTEVAIMPVGSRDIWPGEEMEIWVR